METCKLEVKNLCKSFGGNDVLKNIHFQIAPGEFVAVMGDCGIIGLNRKNLTNTGVLRHSPISLTRKGWLKHCHTDLIKQRCN